MSISENLEQVRRRIAAAAKRAGRDPGEVRLICVTKGIPVERIREAVRCGVREIGENRVQEAKEKRQPLGTVPFGDSPPIRWHLIGHLQRNKARLAVELFDLIHSVDSLELIGELDRQAALRQAQGERELEVLIQVNISGEATKHGCGLEEARRLAKAVLKSRNLRLAGLMTMAPFSENPEVARQVFRELRLLGDQLQRQFLQSTICNRQSPMHLSMGMSQDFEAAVEEGATMVRIGTAIFREGNAVHPSTGSG